MTNLPISDRRRPARFLAELTALVFAVAGSGCTPAAAPPADLDEALGLVRLAFEAGDPHHLEPLYPSGWALVSLSGEPRRSVTGAELERLLARMFRSRAPVAYDERPGSILRSRDGAYALFAPEWSSMVLGTDRLIVELFRIGLERAPAEESAADPPPAARSGAEGFSDEKSAVGRTGWQIREFTVRTR